MGLFGSMAMLYIGFTGPLAGFQAHHIEGFRGMTYLDMVFSYASQPGETELRAIDSMREVYGILRVLFDEKNKTVQVRFDASRMKRDAVAKLLRQAGIDISEPMAIA